MNKSKVTVFILAMVLITLATPLATLGYATPAGPISWDTGLV